jgi:hypothetical protein
MATYAAEQASALADITAAGGVVTFTRAASAAQYEPLRGGFAPSAETAIGVAISRPANRVGDVQRFVGLDLVAQTITILVVAAAGLGFPPAAGHRAEFGGTLYTVRDVSVLDVNGAEPILYFVAVSV